MNPLRAIVNQLSKHTPPCSLLPAADLVVRPGDVLGQTGEAGELFAAATDDLASHTQDDAVMTLDQSIQPLQRPHSSLLLGRTKEKILCK